jgi:cysteine desulfurase/selenocysteine lyase
MPTLPLGAEEIPALRVEEGAERPCYLDNGATTLKPERVVRAIDRFYRTQNAPVHRGVYDWSQEATGLYENARETVAAFVGAEREELIFTRGTTEGLNLFARSWGETHLEPGDEIALAPQEHHSNFVPWQQLAERTGATLRWLPLREDGRLDLEAALEVITERTALVTICHVSNVLGVANPVESLFRRAREVGAVSVLDGAQSVPHRPVDVREIGCDALAFSGHKMLGPTGIGGLVVRGDLMEELAPYETGGGMIDRVSTEGTTFAEGPERFEAGTPHAAGAVGLAEACRFLTEIGMAEIESYERRWGRKAVERIRSIPDVHLIGPPGETEAEGALVSLRMKDLHPHDLAVLLDARGVMCRAGHHCTMPLHDHFGGEASLRASGYLYNDEEDLDRLVDALVFARKALRGEVSTPFSIS